MLIKRILIGAAGICLAGAALTVGGCEKMQSGRQLLFAACQSTQNGSEDECNCFVNGISDKANDDVMRDMAIYMVAQNAAGSAQDEKERAKALDAIDRKVAARYGYQEAATFKSLITQNLKGCSVGSANASKS